jgi:anaphase-promoting complex subunit 3
LALLGKLCRKSNRADRAIKYFRMSLSLDPFLFTSFQALAELGEKVDVSLIFGGSNPAAAAVLNSAAVFHDNQNNNSVLGSSAAFSHSFMAGPDSGATMMKTPLQLMGASSARRVAFETPGLTPIPSNKNMSTAVSDSVMAPSSAGMSTFGGNFSAHTPTMIPSPIGRKHNPVIVRRARQVAARHYYPPSPDTPMTNLSKSMRYLGGLGPPETPHGRSLFAASNENNNFTTGSTINNPTSTVMWEANNDLKPEPSKESGANDEKVQEILDLLALAGSAYQNLCLFKCRGAIQSLQQLPISQQQTSWALHQSGRAYLEQGDFLSAQRCLEQMHKQDPGRMEGLELLSTVYWQLKKEIDLANLAQRALDWDYGSPQAHCVAGNCFSLQKDHETALVFFSRSLQLDSDFTYTHTLSGYEFMSNEDFDKATACFREALRTDDRHYNAWYGLGAIYHRQEKFDLAEYHFERAVSIHPSSSVLRCNLGMAQNANGKAYQALETLSEAFRLDPRNPQARFQRATIYSALHRPEEALVELKIVRDAAPREATVHFAMGKVLKRLGRPHEAMKCFLTAMDLDPKDSQLIKSAMDKLDEPEVDEADMAHF